MRRIRKDSPEKAAARLERFLASPPERLAPERIAVRRSKSIRRAKPSGALEECCAVQQWRCAYCQQHMRRKRETGQEWRTATLDHVLPVSRGGTNGKHNLVAACERCNRAKGSMTAEEFRAAQSSTAASAPGQAQGYVTEAGVDQGPSK